MKKRRLRLGRLTPKAGWLARLLLSQLMAIFLALGVLGVVVGLQTRPPAGAIPYDELFDGMNVVSYRETPADTTARFVVQLSSCGRVFSQYDVDAGRFLPPPRGRDYSRNITGTHYQPLRVRGHVATGFWLDVPNASRRSLLPEQFSELYRSTLDFVKPVSLLTDVLGIASGYSIGYRIGNWNGSLCSRVVQERVLAAPGLGRTLAREAWRRVLLEPAVMADESDASRFAAVAGNQRLYSNFFRVALNDSDGFIPREAERLAASGRPGESRAMLQFAAAVRRAALDSVHLRSADFSAVERWASLLDRGGHWAYGSIPPAGEERVRLLGTFAWYGLAPPAEANRVWVGPRLLVREGETEGFVTDDLPATGVGCPIAWRERLDDDHTGVTAMANAWLTDRPEFIALATLAQRTTEAVRNAGRGFAGWQHDRATRAHARRLQRVAVSARRRPPDVAMPVSSDDEEDGGMPIERTFRSFGDEGHMVLVSSDSATGEALSRVVQSAFSRADSLVAAAGRSERGERPAPRPAWDAAIEGMGARDVAYDTTAKRMRATFVGIRMDLAEIATGNALDVAADTLRALGVRDALLEVSNVTVAIGEAPGDEVWRVAIRDPRGRVPSAGWIRLEPGDAACSARSHAAAGPARPAGRPLAVTVLAPSALSARAWRTELMGMSVEEAKRVARERSELSVVLIEPGTDGPDILWIESDIREQFHFDDAARPRFRVESF